ncbi:hypothetical protein ABTF92_19865, partial [Acinetobacter baumannii]
SGDWQESEADKASNLDSKADQELTRAQILALEERTAIARENAGRLYFYLYDLFANHITSNTPRETIIENVTTDIQMFKVT